MLSAGSSSLPKTPISRLSRSSFKIAFVALANFPIGRRKHLKDLALFSVEGRLTESEAMLGIGAELMQIGLEVLHLLRS